MRKKVKLVTKSFKISKGLMDSYQDILDNVLHRTLSEDLRLYILVRISQSRDPRKLKKLRVELERYVNELERSEK